MVQLSLMVTKSDVFKPSDCIFMRDFDFDLDYLFLNHSSVTSDYNQVFSTLRNVGKILKSLGLNVRICVNVVDIFEV